MDKKLLVVCGISIALIGGAFFIGSTQAKTTLNDSVVTIKTAEEKKSALLLEIENAEKRLEDLRTDLDTKQEEFDEAKRLISQKDSLTQEITTLDTELTTKKTESDTLSDDIESKNKEIEKLEKGIITLKSEPRNLPAGDFKVGADIDAGRYRVTPSSSAGVSGNFFVNDGMNANVILGNDSYSVNEYIVTLSEGDRINQTLPVTFELVQD